MTIPSIPGKEVTVPDIPIAEKVDLSPDKTAVIIVDMQNDFVKPEGNLYVEAAEGTIPNIQRLLESARKTGAKVVYTQDTSFEGDPEWEIWPKHCEKGTWGWEIVEELAPQSDKELVFVKNRYDGFYGTSLNHYLTNLWGVKHLVIVGTVSNICVLHTAASAGLRWFNIVVPADGISSMTEFDQALTLRQVTTLYGGKVVKATADIAFE